MHTETLEEWQHGHDFGLRSADLGDALALTFAAMHSR